MRLKSLEKLIDHQERLLKTTRRRLAEENSKLLSHQERLVFLAEDEKKQNQLFFSAPASSFLTYQNFLERNRATTKHLLKEIDEVEERIERIKEEIKSIFTDMKGISIVRDRIYIATKRKAEKRVQQMIEENFLLRKFCHK